MIQKVLALLVRSLRTDARLLRSHLMRLGIGILILVQLWAVHEASSLTGSPGLAFFTSLTIANLVIISLFGSGVFANAIVEEKEEQTLPLLRMADIGPLSLLLGKWLPRLVMAILMLLIQFPFAMLSVTLGGVLWSQVYAAFWMLLAYLFLVGNIGLFFSVWCHRAGTAFGLTVAFLFFFTVGAHQGATIASHFSLNAGTSRALDTVADGFKSINCISRADQIFSVGFDASPFDTYFWGNVAIGCAFFLLSWLTFDRATSREPSPRSWWQELVGPPARSTSPARRPKPAGAVESETRPAPQPARRPRGRHSWDAALVYKDFHQIAGGPLFLLIRVVVGAAAVFGTIGLIFSMGGGSSASEAVEILGGTSLTWGILFLILEVAALFARSARAEIKDRTWATLVLLPKSIPDILLGKLAGGGFAVLPALAMITFGVLTTGHEWIGEFSNSGFIGAFFWICAQILLAFQLAMYFGLVFDFAIWPLAVCMAGFCVIIGNTMTIACFAASGARGGEEVFMGMLGIGAVVLTGIFFHLSITRLEDLAADEK